MTTSSGRRNRRTAWLIGLLITALTAGVYQLGLLDWSEAKVYDACVQLTPAAQQVPDSQRIAHIDIDDGSLAEVGRWPWPRAHLARIVRRLTQAGAKAIVLDIIMPEPQPPRPAEGGPGQNYDVADLDAQPAYQQVATQPDVRDDELLARAIRRSGRAFLAMHFESRAQSAEPPQAARDWSAPPAADKTGPADVLSPAGRAWARLRIADLVRANPGLTAMDVARAVHAPAASESGPARDLIFQYYRHAVAMRVLESRSLPGNSSLGAMPWPVAANSVPPIPMLARAAAGAGFVCFEPDSDGAIRAMPPMMVYQGRVYPQLSMLVACRMLDVPLERMSADGDQLILPNAILIDGKRADVRIPLDARHRMLVNWRHASAGWEEQFVHVSARDLLNISRNLELISQKRKQLVNTPSAGVQLYLETSSPGWTLPEYNNSRLCVDVMSALVAGEDLSLLPPPADADEETQRAVLVTQASNLTADMRKEWLRGSRSQVEGYETQALDALHKEYAALQTVDRAALSPAKAGRLRRIRDLAEGLFSPDEVRREIARLKAAVRRDRTRLEQAVRGRVCFVGSTATGAADFVLTPAYSRCPGVIVHSNILNTVLTGQFIRPAPRWMNLLAIVLCGLAATALTAGLGPRLSMGMVLATMAAVATANVLVVFARWREWMVLAAPMVGVIGSAAAVILYRWWTEARQRRWVTEALGSYTSPSVARRIADQRNLHILGGDQRTITCMFTDLKGFTAISERLKADQTVALLNRYFARMTEALFRHEGTISKFLGDGIFAFFGAPDVQLDHARKAAHAALDCRSELRAFCHDLAKEGAPILSMRIGISTGPAIVGDCGTTRKRDYTALGDTVNLASRLEGANKFFGTSIMVSGPTADELDDAFLLRSLGRILVVGKREAVAVFELVDRLADSTPADRAWAYDFGEAVEAYRQRQFAAAMKAFEKLQAAKPTDKPAGVYIQLCRDAAAGALGPDWTGDIVLTEK